MGKRNNETNRSNLKKKDKKLLMSLEERAEKFAINSIKANLRTWGFSEEFIERFIRENPELVRSAKENYLKGVKKFMGVLDE